MGTILLETYLYCNLLLAAAGLLWLLLKLFLCIPGIDPGQRQQLQLARGLFVAALLLPCALAALDALWPSARLWLDQPVLWFAGELSIVARSGPYFSLQNTFSVPAIACVLLLGSVAVASLRLVREWRRLRQLVASSMVWKCMHGIQLLVSSDVGSPFTTRALGSRLVVVPESLLESPPQLRLALRHELQHLRQHDPEWLLLLEVVRLLCAWNPALRLWSREFEQLQELACDEALVRERRVDVRAYGECLLTVAAQSTPSFIGASNMVPASAWFGTRQSTLRRRIMKLIEMGHIRYGRAKTMIIASLLGTGLCASSLLVVAADGGARSSDAERREYLPIVVIQPQYPARALEEKLEGWVQVQFTVDEQGAVQSPVAVDSCAGPAIATCVQGGEVFVAAALAAIDKFKFQPRLEEGRAVLTEGVQYVFRFNLTDDDE